MGIFKQASYDDLSKRTKDEMADQFETAMQADVIGRLLDDFLTKNGLKTLIEYYGLEHFLPISLVDKVSRK